MIVTFITSIHIQINISYTNVAYDGICLTRQISMSKGSPTDVCVRLQTAMTLLKQDMFLQSLGQAVSSFGGLDYCCTATSFIVTLPIHSSNGEPG